MERIPGPVGGAPIRPGDPLDPEEHDGVVELEVVDFSPPNTAHGRHVARLVELAKRFESDIRISVGGRWRDVKSAERGGREENAKSIFGVMRTYLHLVPGHPFYLRAKGPDAERAVRALGAALEEGR